MKQTQLESYNKIKEEWSTRHEQIIDFFAQNKKNLTIHDIVKGLGLPINSVSGRLTELEKEGFIKPTGKKYNKSTKRNVTTWSFYDE